MNVEDRASVSQTIQTLLRHLHGTAEPAGTDADLVERFVRETDAAAFAALVGRHGPMVLGVCRRVLQNAQDAEDAFQATFLVLARKAATLGRGDPVGAWLHGVACRVAAHVRTDRARRMGHERRVTAMPPTEPDPAVLWDDLRPVLDEEVQRLPERYRVPLVLCYLNGKTYDEAAQEIGCPKGTLATRLTKARELLRDRLSSRGVSLSAAALAAFVAENARAAIPAPLLCTTVGVATSSTVPVGITTLATEVLKAMAPSKLKTVTALLVAVVLLGAGAGALAYHATDLPPGVNTPAPPVSAAADTPPVAEPPAPEKEKAAEEYPWGAADKGVQVRLRPLKVQWKADDTPTFHIDLRNQGEKDVGLVKPSTYWEVEFDGTWYGRKLEKASVQLVETPLKPGAEAKAWVDLGLYPLWLPGVTGADRYTSAKKGEDLPLTPGKHKVRVAYSVPFEPHSERRPVSNVVEIEILKAAEKEKVPVGVAPAPELDIRSADGKVLVTAEQIRAYDWATHTLTLTPKVREELATALRKSAPGALVKGIPFEVAVGGKTVYSGKFTSVESSVTIAAPVVVVDLATIDPTLGADQLRIQLGYPGAAFFKDDDPRGDERIRDALKAAGKLPKAHDNKPAPQLPR